MSPSLTHPHSTSSDTENVHTVTHSYHVIHLHTYTCIQQECVLTELEEYAPVDSISVQNVVLYLKACHKMFERGILEKKGSSRV